MNMHHNSELVEVLVFPYVPPTLQDIKRLPDWARDHLRTQKAERCVLILDYLSQRTAVLTAGEALAILERSKKTKRWMEDGLPISRLEYTASIIASSNKELRAIDEGDAQTTSRGKLIETELFRLMGEQAIRVLVELEANENDLRFMTHVDNQASKVAMNKAYRLIFGIVATAQEKEIDLSSRPLSWQTDGEHSFTCKLPHAGARVSRDSSRAFWIASARQADGPVRTSKPFVHLREALEWAEREVINPAAWQVTTPSNSDAPKKPRVKFVLTEEHRKALEPYWIKPEALEPSRPTYRVLIDVDCPPVRFDTLEDGLGSKMEVNKKYFHVDQLPQFLGLRHLEVFVEQLLGKKSGWYLITSTSIYYQQAMVLSLAQQMWEQSEITKLFRGGKILRARYGYQEVETGYVEYIGGLKSESDVWESGQSREAYMSSSALRLTLINALDVDGFITYLGASVKDRGALLTMMHQVREESDVIPEEAREESRQWLREHRSKPNRA